MSEFYVNGSHGEMRADALTGHVIELNNDDYNSIEYNVIVRFDIDEWRQKYPDEELNGMNMDILDIGFWCSDGEYVPPEEEWREDLRRENEYIDRAER